MHLDNFPFGFFLLSLSDNAQRNETRGHKQEEEEEEKKAKRERKKKDEDKKQEERRE